MATLAIRNQNSETMKLDRKVSEIMTREVVSVESKQTLPEILSLFRKNRIRHIPVLGDKKVVGIISRSDINRLTFGALFDNQDSTDEPILEMLSIAQVMSADPKVVSTDDSLRKVAEIFAEEEFHALPVVEEGKLKGIITTTDLIKQLLIDNDDSSNFV